MSRTQSIHIDFQLTDEQAKNELWYEQVYFFLKDNGWVLDLNKPILFIEPGFAGFADTDMEEISVPSEEKLIEMIREKERLNEPMGLGIYDDGELAFWYELKKTSFGEMNFWFLVSGEIIIKEVCVIFEHLSRKIVKPFCDTFHVESIDLTHG